MHFKATVQLEPENDNSYTTQRIVAELAFNAKDWDYANDIVLRETVGLALKGDYAGTYFPVKIELSLISKFNSSKLPYEGDGTGDCCIYATKLIGGTYIK